MAKKKKNKGKQRKQKRHEELLRNALDSNQRIVKYGTDALDDFRAVLDAADPASAIRERMMGLLFAAGLLAWHYSPPGEAGPQFSKLADGAFTMAGQTLAAHTPQDEE